MDIRGVQPPSGGAGSRKLAVQIQESSQAIERVKHDLVRLWPSFQGVKALDGKALKARTVALLQRAHPDVAFDPQEFDQQVKAEESKGWLSSLWSSQGAADDAT